MAFHRIHFLANETPSSKSLNHFSNEFLKLQPNNPVIQEIRRRLQAGQTENLEVLFDNP
jgi:hypothetical protein